MSIEKSYKIRTKGKNLFLRVTRGHFMKTNGHMNYYIDVTMQKSRLSEARAVAEELVSYYSSSAVIDTILCLDEMQVIATCMADLLTRSGFMNLNEHQTIYPSPVDHPNPGIKPGSPTLQADSLPSEPPGNPFLVDMILCIS